MLSVKNITMYNVRNFAENELNGKTGGPTVSKPRIKCAKPRRICAKPCRKCAKPRRKCAYLLGRWTKALFLRFILTTGGVPIVPYRIVTSKKLEYIFPLTKANFAKYAFFDFH